MIIGVDTRTFAAGQLTGVGIYTWEILNHLLKLDADNQYKFFYSGFKQCRFERRQRWLNLPRVSWHHYQLPNKLLNFSLKYFHRPFLDEVIGGCDIFWFPNLNFWQVSPAVKTVVTVHDLSFIKMPWTFSPKMRLWHQALSIKEKLQRAERIIAVSENTKTDIMESLGIKSEKIKVIYSGVGNQSETSEIKKIKSKYRLPEKFILFLGTLEPRKNVTGLIQAYESLNRPEIDLVIAGGQGWLYKKIYHRAQKSVLKNNIHFTGYVDPEERRSFYQSAEMLVWPSFYEGFGFPPLEAMSAGCPVITSANSSLPEVVGDGALLVDPYNIQEIKKAMELVLDNQDVRKNMIEKGYLQARQYRWADSAHELYSLFEELQTDKRVVLQSDKRVV